MTTAPTPSRTPLKGDELVSLLDDLIEQNQQRLAQAMFLSDTAMADKKLDLYIKHEVEVKIFQRAFEQVVEVWEAATGHEWPPGEAE